MSEGSIPILTLGSNILGSNVDNYIQPELLQDMIEKATVLGEKAQGSVNDISRKVQLGSIIAVIVCLCIILLVAYYSGGWETINILSTMISATALSIAVGVFVASTAVERATATDAS
jgi:ABC-type proline/glycine betaine transport system permease subunit